MWGTLREADSNHPAVGCKFVDRHENVLHGNISFRLLSLSPLERAANIRWINVSKERVMGTYTALGDNCCLQGGVVVDICNVSWLLMLLLL